MTTDNDWRDAMIEEAAKAIQYAFLAGDGYRGGAKAALAVFEKALGEASVTPTEGEREVLADLIPLDLVHDRGREGVPQDVFEAADCISKERAAQSYVVAGHDASVEGSQQRWYWACSCGAGNASGSRTEGRASAARDRHLRVAREADEAAEDVVMDYPTRELSEEEWATYLDAQERKQFDV